MIPTINSSFTNSEYIFQVSNSQGEVVGEATARLSANLLYWDFKEIVVLEDERRKGYGTSLVNHLCNYLWEIQLLPIVVHPGVDPATAITTITTITTIRQWYVKLGFQPEQHSNRYTRIPAGYKLYS